MEAVIEVERVERERTPYEQERGKPMPETIHSAVQMNLGIALATRYPDLFRLLPELTLATEPVVTVPDLAIYPAFELDYANRPPRRSDAPATCVEIQSISQGLEELLDKVRIYFQFGVKSCWIVQPSVRGVFVFTSSDDYDYYHGDDTLHDTLLGVEVPLTAVFK